MASSRRVNTLSTIHENSLDTFRRGRGVIEGLRKLYGLVQLVGSSLQFAKQACFGSSQVSAPAGGFQVRCRCPTDNTLLCATWPSALSVPPPSHPRLSVQALCVSTWTRNAGFDRELSLLYVHFPANSAGHRAIPILINKQSSMKCVHILVAAFTILLWELFHNISDDVKWIWL
jgi:hypothetical protein